MFSSIEVWIAAHRYEQEVMIIGGASLCEQVLPKVSRLYITKIEGKFDGDVYFPAYDEAEWGLTSLETHQPNEKNKFVYHFITMERK